MSEGRANAASDHRRSSSPGRDASAAVPRRRGRWFAAATVALVGATTVALPAAAAAAPVPGWFGSLDQATNGVVSTVSGWALDPADVNGTAEVHIYVNGVGQANLQADLARPDVNAAFDLTGGHGFSAEVALQPGSNEVCAWIVPSDAAASVLMGCATAQGPGPAQGSLDAAFVAAPGTAQLTGWALDPNDAAEPTEVHVYVDGAGFAFPADGARADVNAVLGVSGDHGFSVEVPLQEGVNDVCAFAIAPSGNTLLGCRTIPGSTAAFGSLDAAVVTVTGDQIALTGWTLDPNAPNAASEVHVYVDGVGYARQSVLPRPDVNAALGTSGDHGFAVTVPLPEGEHTVCVFAVSATGNDNSLLDCGTAVGEDTGLTTLNLLNINDFHGRIDDNAVAVAGTVEQLREAGDADTTLLLSAGDNIGASLFASSVQQDQPTIDMLNAMEVSASAVGNHEFDQGYQDLVGRVIGGEDGNEPVHFPYLGANVYLAGTDEEPALQEYAVFEVDGLRVGVIGAVTLETPSLVSPGGITEITFGDPVAAVNRVAAQLTDGDEDNGEADVLIAEYHEGAGAGTPDGATLEEEIAGGGAFAEIVTGTSPAVDVIFTGHTHKEYAWQAPVPGSDGTRPVVQTGSYGANIGTVSLVVDEATGDVEASVAANVVRTTSNDAQLIEAYPRVAAVSGIVDAALAEAAEVGDTQVGSVTADITTAFSGGSWSGGVYVGQPATPDNPTPGRDDRASESALGDLVADALRDSLGSEDRGGAELAVVNPGGLRAELLYGEDGVITYAEANAVLPFVNNLWTTTLTGTQLIELLNQQWQTDANGNVPSRPYLQLGLSGNVTYTFDDSLPAGQRITSVTIDGAPLDPAREYRVGTFSFLITGGDNFRAFTGGTDARDSGLVDRDAWIEYLEANPGLTPDFARQAVEVAGVPAEVAAGETIEFQVSGLDLTSLGAPENIELAVRIGDVELAPVTVADGQATVEIDVPAELSGATSIVLTAAPSQTVVTIPLTVTAGSETTVPTTPSTTPADPTDVSTTPAEPGTTTSTTSTAPETTETTTPGTSTSGTTTTSAIPSSSTTSTTTASTTAPA
ncbi:bifunctional metallophosphatase/5'-nucleotidase [Nakamurella leprariae]|uniref:5'-nucleotidase C-terminal domain-containing protein n=1 Tax=Nakamurella leprariae TaxID=2803911 RepID=A0A939C0D2_9ACTN|nr:5'-nucleotidase C-terminal domain-containing protein [Nakamurella leprariae]MBM9469105.1 5'-nucleotidase C-terminal domain-containing protein [Nakamurella leprariae]